MKKTTKFFRIIISFLAIVITFAGGTIFELYYHSSKVFVALDKYTGKILVAGVIISVICYVSNLKYMRETGGSRIKPFTYIFVPIIFIAAMYLFTWCPYKYGHDTVFYSYSMCMMNIVFVFIGDMYEDVIDVETTYE